VETTLEPQAIVDAQPSATCSHSEVEGWIQIAKQCKYLPEL